MDEPKRWGPTREPVRWAVGIPGLATAVIALLLGFDVVDWTQDQTALVLAVVTAVIAVLGGRARAKVTPDYLAQHAIREVTEAAPEDVPDELLP